MDQQWWHTASIVCVTANAHRDENRRPDPFHPREFHPFHCEERPEPAKDTWSVDDILNVLGGR